LIIVQHSFTKVNISARKQVHCRESVMNIRWGVFLCRAAGGGYAESMERGSPPDSLPAWLWRATALGVIAVLALIGAGVLFIASGASDPPVAGPVVWADPALTWATERDSWARAPVALPTPLAAFTVTVRARLPADADPLAAWGVWLAEADGSRVIYAINGAGYWTIRRCPPEHAAMEALEACPGLRPEWRWLFHPRLHAPGESNTITLHREPDGAIRLRVNGERLGAAPVEVTGVWGVWARPATTHPAWERAELRASEKGGTW